MVINIDILKTGCKVLALLAGLALFFLPFVAVVAQDGPQHPGSEKAAAPAELQSFNAQIVRDGIRLSWTAEQTTNGNAFEIERTNLQYGSLRTADWNTVATVDGYSADQMSKYSYHDGGAPQAGHFLAYRLKQVAQDGAVRYSPIAQITFATAGSFELSPLYPNPVTSASGATRTTIHYTVSMANQVSVTVYDSRGAEIAVIQDGYHEAGEYNMMFDASGLVPGTYFASVRVGESQQIQKLSVVR